MRMLGWVSFFGVGLMVVFVVVAVVVIPRRTGAPLFRHNLTTTVGVLLCGAIALVSLLGVLYLMLRPGDQDHVGAVQFTMCSFISFAGAFLALLPAIRYQDVLAHPPGASFWVMLRCMVGLALLWEIGGIYFLLIW